MFVRKIIRIFEANLKHTVMSTLEFNQKITDFSQNLKPAAINLTKNMEEAQDLIQETVFKALTNKDKFQEGTNLSAWMYTIMKNIFINNYRRKKKKNTIIDSTDNLFYINSHAHNIPNEGEININLEALEKEVVTLRSDYKVPFMMHFEGYKYEEIAETLQLPIGTVKSRIHLARKELKKKLRYYIK